MITGNKINQFMGNGRNRDMADEIKKSEKSIEFSIANDFMLSEIV